MLRRSRLDPVTPDEEIITRALATIKEQSQSRSGTVPWSPALRPISAAPLFCKLNVDAPPTRPSNCRSRFGTTRFGAIRLGTAGGTRVRLKRALCLYILSGLATVHAAPPPNLGAFLAGLRGSPEVQAGAATVRAAAANLAQARPPVALDFSTSAGVRADLPVSLTNTNLALGVTAYPFVYGQLGDTVRLRELELEQARLNERQALAQLEARVLEGALAVQLSARALGLARAAAASAAQGYDTTRVRVRRGVATAGELRAAAAGRRRAQNLVLNAEADRALAAQTLAAFVGSSRIPALSVKVPEGVPASLRRAELAVAAAQIGSAGAVRPFLPVAEVGYVYDVSARERLSVSVGSDDLAPRVGYAFSGDSVYGGSTDGAFSLSVSADLSPDDFQNATRLGELLRAAEENLRAARRDARTDDRALRNRWAAAGRGRELAAFIYRDAERSLAEVRRRESLGVGNPLETQAAAASLAEAGLALGAARREQFAALLDLYELYGLPVSETLTPRRLTSP